VFVELSKNHQKGLLYQGLDSELQRGYLLAELGSQIKVKGGNLL